MAGVQFREPLDLNKLEIRNAALQNLAADPSTPVDGQVWQRTDIDKTKISTGAKVETVRYESNNLFDASTASGNGPLIINTDGSGTDTALSVGATGINSPRLLIDVATQTPKLQAFSSTASVSMEPNLLRATDANSKVDLTPESLKVYRTDIVQSMELTDSDLLRNGVSVLGGTGGTASSVSFTPTGNLTSTNVQAAIAELDSEVVHIAGKETITGTKTLYSDAYAGVPNFARTNATVNSTIWCANVEKITPAASTPADGMGPGLAFVHSKDNAPDTKYGLGAIEFRRNGSDTSGKFVVNTRNAGADSFPLMADASSTDIFRALNIRPAASTAGSELRFMPTYNAAEAGKQFVSWWNIAGDTRRALIGYREGALPDTNDKDLRIVSTYPSGTAMATGLRGVRIGTALDTTSETSTGSFTVAPYNNTHVGIWGGAIAAASRTSSNYTLVSGNTSTWVNVPSASGRVGLAVNDVSMVTVEQFSTTEAGIWCGSLAASSTSSNYTLVAGDTAAYINAPSEIHGRIANVDKLYVSASVTSTPNLLIAEKGFRESYTSSAVTTGSSAWNDDTYPAIILTAQLTGNRTLMLTHADTSYAQQTHVHFRQGSTAYTFTLSKAGISFRLSKTTTTGSGSLVIPTSAISTVNAYYTLQLNWIGSTCTVAVL